MCYFLFRYFSKHQTIHFRFIFLPGNSGNWQRPCREEETAEEMRQLDSLIMKAADETAVPAGGALAVDRDKFSAVVTKTLKDLPNVHVHEEEITEIPKDGITIIATGPLTSDTLAEQIKEFCGTDSLHFFDAAAPIVAASSINRDIVYKKSRYDKGEAAYLNCPMCIPKEERAQHPEKPW